jgi:hypothetical protein
MLQSRNVIPGSIIICFVLVECQSNNSGRSSLFRESKVWN